MAAFRMDIRAPGASWPVRAGAKGLIIIIRLQTDGRLNKIFVLSVRTGPNPARVSRDDAPLVAGRPRRIDMVW